MWSGTSEGCCVLRVFFTIVWCLIMLGCERSPDGQVRNPKSTIQSDSEVGRSLPWERIRAESGRSVLSAPAKVQFQFRPQLIEFTYKTGATGRRLMSEATGGGVAWLDYDRDEQPDLYLVQGGSTESAAKQAQYPDFLLRKSEGKFQDITSLARVLDFGYGQGVAAGDYNNDGFDDLFVGNIGQSTLWINRGDGTFEDATALAPAVTGWASSAAWADIDRDGDLDLYVCRYCDYDPVHPVVCKRGDTLVQCQPREIAPQSDICLQNRGDGAFDNATARWGLEGPENRALGVVVADLVGDECPEIYVANDGSANFLFSQDRGPESGFRDLAPRLGCALDGHGRAQGSMGIAIGDVNGDLLLDLFITNFEGEANIFYANSVDTGFADVTAHWGAIPESTHWVGFGAVMEDFDQNGELDLFIANGHIDDLGRSHNYKMPSRVLSFNGKHWSEVGEAAGLYFRNSYIGRGCAQGDWDNDGDFDLVVVHQNDATALLENVSDRGDWLQLQFVGKKSNRRGIGTKVELSCNGRKWYQELYGGGSYCSSRQPSLIFGLGANTKNCDINVSWPSGIKQRLRNCDVNRRLVRVEPSETPSEEEGQRKW